MKWIFQALLASLLIHALYMISMISAGYFQTKTYEPNMALVWNKVDTLQNEVAFGSVVSPLFGLFSFFGVAVVCGIAIFLYKRLVKKVWS